jgi:hypothetical protein
MGRTGGSHGENKKCVHKFDGEGSGKQLLGRPRRLWEDNNKMDLREIGCEVENWMKLAQD